MPLTPTQVAIIKQTVPVLQDHGVEITTCFYSNMLSEVPSLKNVFNHANQLSGAQAKALASSLYAYASYIDDLGVLSPAVERICQKHVSLYVQPEQYDTVGNCLLGAMKEVLGKALTPDIHTAWAVAYRQLADLMIGREAQLYEERDQWTNWRDFVITRKVQESEEITSFYLEPQTRNGEMKCPLPSYHPGQFISIRTDVPQLKHLQPRQYSLSDAPRPNHYRVSVKRERGLDPLHPEAPEHPGFISNVLHDHRKVGDVIQVSHPAGDFFVDVTQQKDKKQPLVLISAGVGLTPLLSILQSLVESGSTRPISWIHATRSSAVQAFASVVRDITRRCENVHAVVFNKSPFDGKDIRGVDYDRVGRMSLEKLDKERDLFLDRNDAEYYVCGPENFMADMQEKLVDYRVGPERIKLEVFGTGAMPKV
ncbi:hypothetical protein MMC26_001136 [Xylographa opegraphella]|nr:hypothetical protein [Xylographa opegraphella]